jgi:16S rRNA (guanine1516-N2)-methyltransferase
MLTKFAVTFGKNCRGQVITEAKSWAAALQVPFVPRLDSMSLETMLTEYRVEGLLIATSRGPRIFTSSGTFFFHPGMGELRWKNLFGSAKARQTMPDVTVTSKTLDGQVPVTDGGNIKAGPVLTYAMVPDHFAVATQLQPGQRYLDCTLGLGADALIASHLVGDRGRVVGLEASLLLHFVVSRGLKNYQSRYPELNRDLHRLETYRTEALPFLQQQPADSFDVIYFDPMFRFPVQQSSGMQPLRPLAFEQPLSVATVQEALRVAPRVVIKERGEKILRDLGCREFIGGRYSRVKFGIATRPC